MQSGGRHGRYTRSMRTSPTPLLLLAFAAFAAPFPAAGQKALVTYSTLSTATALRAAQAALAHCQKAGYMVSVAVVDRSAHPLALLRDNLAGPHTPRTATGKAATAASFRMDTSTFATQTQAGPQSGIRALPDVVAVGGGLPINAKGALVGAIGVSGAPEGEADDACAKAGVDAISDSLEFE